jgi:hypothetical protein
MLSAVARGTCELAVILSAFIGNPVSAGSPNTKIAPVAAMYHDFAWQALSSDSKAFGRSLASQSARTLSQYFEPRLAKLIADDAACKRRTQKLCKLDFDILFDSQDPRVTDLSIEEGPSNTVEVRFKDPVSYEASLITFTVIRQASAWRIGEVAYMRDGPRKLRALLSVDPAPGAGSRQGN